MTASKNISTGLMMAVLTVLCWASYNVAAKSGIDAGMSAETLTFLRFAVPGIIAIPIATKICLRGAPSSASLPRLLVLVCLGGPLFGMAGVSGYAFAPLSHGLLFAPVAVFVSASFLGGLLLKEKMGMSRLMGALIMFAGLAVLVGFQLSGLSQDWWRGAACFIAAGVMWGSYTALIKRWDIPMLEGTALVAAGSAIVAILLFQGCVAGHRGRLQAISGFGSAQPRGRAPGHR
ncbi:MAG: DMT family transporter, partial [Pseudomonadota bacterium]